MRPRKHSKPTEDAAKMTLQFLQIIESKILGKSIYHLSDLYFKEIPGLAKFISRYTL